jgi:hypothetical protein
MPRNGGRASGPITALGRGGERSFGGPGAAGVLNGACAGCTFIIWPAHHGDAAPSLGHHASMLAVGVANAMPRSCKLRSRSGFVPGSSSAVVGSRQSGCEGNRHGDITRWFGTR